MLRYPLIQKRRVVTAASARRFERGESGAVTVEAALWIPFFLLFTFGIGQLGLIFYGQARMLEVAQDANRSLSVGEFTSEEEAENWIEASLARLSPDARAEATVDGRIITTSVRAPAGQLGGVIIFAPLTGFEVEVVAQQVVEY